MLQSAQNSLVKPPGISTFGKNFNDFVNEYRILEVTRKMQDTSYDRLTMLGIAFDSGFNSKSTFNRTFREITGKDVK